VGVNINDQMPFFSSINTTLLKTEEILVSSNVLFYVDNSQLLDRCLDRSCEEGEFLRQEMFICPGIPFLKI